MPLHYSKGEASQPSATPADDGADETDQEFEDRIYSALMRVARTTSARTRSALGSCVMMGTPYAESGESVQDTIQRFIEEAEL